MIRYFLVIVILIISFQITAQEHSIPFEEEGWVYVDVKVNNSSEILSFVFDTGASSSVISKAAASRLNIKSNYQQSVSGASGNETYDIATNQVLHIQGLKLSVPLVMVDLKHLEERSGRPIDGIVGYDIISNFVTHLDFNSKQIKLYKNVKTIKDITSYKSTPIKSIRPIPIVPLEVTLKNGKKFKGDFYFDSGANSTLIFTSAYVKKYKLRQSIGETYERRSSGLTSNQTSNLVGDIMNVKFDDYIFEDIPVSLSGAKHGVLSRGNISGILGAKIINRFQVILDYKNNMIYIKPNDNYKKPFKRNYTGLSLIKKEGKFIIEGVVVNSMAKKLGIKKGDELLMIDDYQVSTMKAINELFQQEGKTLRLKMKHQNGSEEDYQLKLQRLLR